ncbi:hypothetical protein [Clostridium tetani]|uniref:hypothetical protein n=1 Tax=Clostridium tetani TaxID=1513 RepID=UPI0005134AD9|nr:hypothetical protein [Clostridium tetani]KGI36859.1 hypothetical protein LA33_12060 [Clostridium tetani ATCC 9441]KGI41534.1 hypothetical protein KY55_13865 [Clostridium tetani]RXI67870.1 hypothetical protein DP127_13795 [Clostridium tetani]SUY82432.1 Uncharacterised protein [Clostridium tetani]BDR77058.1 hypothetical protein K154306013_p11090 [Clostridium tetani]
MKNLTLNKLFRRHEPRNDKDNITCKTNNNNKSKGIFILTIERLLSFRNVTAATDVAVDTKINSAGGALLSVVRSFGYWICLIMCGLEIIKSLMQGDTRSISKIIIKYILGFSALYFLPWLFDLIREVFI